MRKIVINSCHGGFGLTKPALRRYAELNGGRQVGEYDIPRDDPKLVQVVEELGAEADGLCAKLKVVEIPEDVDWQIEEYDGLEWVAEKHRIWE